jgi:TRAP-type C4-dicarboxylate transport system permease small subunit
VVGAGLISVACLVVIGLTLFVSVVLRYLSGSSLSFATELPTYLFPWLVCSGIVAAAGASGHLAVDFLVERMPPVVRRAVRTVMWLLVTLTLVIIVLAALRLRGSYAGQSTPILHWPAGLSYLSFPLALVALLVHALGRLVAALLGHPPAPAFLSEAQDSAPDDEHASRSVEAELAMSEDHP